MPTLISSTGGAESETPDGVADAPASRAPKAVRGLDGALEGRAGLGDAEVQRPVALLGEHLVGATMTTGSLCLTEILKSWKSCSSNSDASQTADSTRASGVALPYFSRSRGVQRPALTPIRIEMPGSLAALAIARPGRRTCGCCPG